MTRRRMENYSRSKVPWHGSDTVINSLNILACIRRPLNNLLFLGTHQRLNMSDDEASHVSREARIPPKAGLKRKRIQFVPEAQASAQNQIHQTSSFSASEQYLSIVFKKGTSSKNSTAVDLKVPNASNSRNSTQGKEAKDARCEICNLLLDVDSHPDPVAKRPHEASIAHMVCLEHSHPPPDLDRTRPGLRYLSSYGWDPDSRLGLGASGAGIRAPIKVKVKYDTIGLGLQLKEGVGTQEKNKKLLDAGQARRLEFKNKRKGEKLQEIFYGNDDIQKYLGGV